MVSVDENTGLKSSPRSFLAF